VTAPPHEVARDSPLRLAVEQKLHLVLALLPRVRHWAWSRRGVNLRVEGLEQVHIHSRATQHLLLERKRVGIGARAGHDGEGSVPQQQQFANVSGVKQLLGEKQNLVPQDPHLEHCRPGQHPASPCAPAVPQTIASAQSGSVCSSAKSRAREAGCLKRQGPIAAVDEEGCKSVAQG
jgi:hypothetical protein